MIVIVMAIDFGVLILSDRVAPYFTEATIKLFEVILGILLGALAIQLMLNGLAELDIISMTTGGH